MRKSCVTTPRRRPWHKAARLAHIAATSVGSLRTASCPWEEGSPERKDERLRELVEEYNLRDPRKLLQIAQRQGVAGATAALAIQALASDVGRQFLRPPPRATGKAAATRPDSALQADLIDFSNNLPPTSDGNRYAVVLGDVFTRELLAVPVPSKDPATVARVLKPMIANLTEGGQNFTLSTDQGPEFTNLDLPE